MRKKNSYSLMPFTISILILLLDVCAVFLAYKSSFPLTKWVAEHIFGIMHHTISASVMADRNILFATLAFLLLCAFAKKGHYTQRVPWWGQVHYILKSLALTFVFDFFSFFSLQVPSSRLLITISWGLTFCFILVARQLVFLVTSRITSWKLPTVLIADNETAIDCCHALSADGNTGYHIHTVLLRDKRPEQFDLTMLPREYQRMQVIKGSKVYESFIHVHPECFYIIAIEGFRGKERDRLMEMLETLEVKYAIIPSIKRVHLHGMEPHYFFGNDVMLLHTRNRIHSLFGRTCKRLMDILVAGMAMLVLGPLTLVVWGMKKMEGSQTPVFYGGVRVGKNGKLFPCWKFCTMRQDGDKILAELLARDPVAREEWRRYQKLRNDPRIDSRISKVLRKTSLDEVPQLWNVLVGDMSLVGPRPILDNQREEYGELIRHYVSVRPGLTGLWQVSGRNETSFEQRVSWDSWYIRNWSIWHDIVIMIKTAGVLVTGSGAY